MNNKFHIGEHDKKEKLDFLFTKLAPLSTDEILFLKSSLHNEKDGVIKALKQGVDPKIANSVALREAACYGYCDIVTILAPISEPTTEDSDALFQAAFFGHTECVKILIPFSDPKSQHSRALRWAASNGHYESAKLLVPVSDIDETYSLLQSYKEGGMDVEILSAVIQEEMLQRKLVSPRNNDAKSYHTI